jgi:hypothetical protein
MSGDGTESDFSLGDYPNGDGSIITRKDLRVAVVVMPENRVKYPRSARLIDLSKLNFSELQEGREPENNLHPIDVIATVLYNWDQYALHALIDLDINYFHIGRVSSSNYETYVKLSGRIVTAGNAP